MSKSFFGWKICLAASISVGATERICAVINSITNSWDHSELLGERLAKKQVAMNRCFVESLSFYYSTFIIGCQLKTAAVPYLQLVCPARFSVVNGRVSNWCYWTQVIPIPCGTFLVFRLQLTRNDSQFAIRPGSVEASRSIVCNVWGKLSATSVSTRLATICGFVH